MPFTSNPAFGTRRALLEGIRERLIATRRAVLIASPSRVHTQCPAEIAIEIAHLCQEDFDGIWWVPGGCAAGLPGSFASIAQVLDLPEADSLEQETMIAAVRRHFMDCGRSLLIFDNVAGPDVAETLLADIEGPCVLFTPRQTSWPAGDAVFEIPDFHTPESREFLAARLGRNPNVIDEECAFHLGGVPILLHLYAGCIRSAPSSREELQSTLAQLADKHAQNDKDRIEACLDHLLAKVFSALEDRLPLSAEVFALTAFMGPQPVYVDALRRGRNYLPESLRGGFEDMATFGNAMGALHTAGLARVGRSAFAINPVLQERFVSRLPRDAKHARCEAAVNFLANLFPFKEEHECFELQCTRLIGHVSAAATWAASMGCAQEEAGRLLNQLGLYLRACGQREEAIKYYLHAVACGEANDGPDHPKVAVRINNLGVVYRETGKLTEARDVFRRAIRIFRDAYGPADHMLAMAMRNLVAVAEASKDEEEMERCYRRALKVYADSLGQGHPYLHECLYGLGKILRKQNNLNDARRCFQEAMRCALLCSPPDEAAIAVYARNLGRLLLRAGEIREALEHLETSVALQRKLKGTEDARLPEMLYELANAYRLDDQLPEARKCFEEALGICRTLELNGGLQIRILSRLARVLQAQEEHLAAASYYRDVCQIHEENGGAENPELLPSVIDLGGALEQSDKLSDALACFARALELETKLNTGEVSLGTLHYRIATMKRLLGEQEESFDAFKKAMSADAREHGERHPDVARDLLGLGLVYRDMGDTARAIGNLMRALSIYEELLGKYHAKTIEARNTLESLNEGES